MKHSQYIYTHFEEFDAVVSSVSEQHGDPALEDIISDVRELLANSQLMSQRMMDTNVDREVGTALANLVDLCDHEVSGCCADTPCRHHRCNAPEEH